MTHSVKRTSTIQLPVLIFYCMTPCREKGEMLYLTTSSISVLYSFNVMCIKYARTNWYSDTRKHQSTVLTQTKSCHRVCRFNSAVVCICLYITTKLMTVNFVCLHILLMAPIPLCCDILILAYIHDHQTQQTFNNIINKCYIIRHQNALFKT
jgi:hypothetical protein